MYSNCFTDLLTATIRLISIYQNIENATRVKPMDYDVEAHERVFHHMVREYVVCFLIFFTLCALSYAILSAFKRRPERDEYSVAYEDAVVCKASLLACTFTFAVSVGAIFLLPMSIIANEAILSFPNSYYLQWLNSSLIYTLWNYIFLFSNLSLFVLMPFAYFLVESEGFPGSKKGIMPRVYEALLVFILFCVVLGGLAVVVFALTSGNNSQFLLEVIIDIKNVYLFYLCSFVSFIGVAMLLICTPLGFTRLFSVIGEFIKTPDDLQMKYGGDIDRAVIEEATRAKRNQSSLLICESQNGLKRTSMDGPYAGIYNPAQAVYMTQRRRKAMSKASPSTPLNSPSVLTHEFLSTFRQGLERTQRTIFLRRKILYPTAMLAILILMAISLFMVIVNTGQLLLGGKVFKNETSQLNLGASSLSVFGPIGAGVETTVILYLFLTSIVGFYSLPFSCRLTPRCKDTPITKLIINCAIILILSLALPVLSRTLGITNFDLLGNYGQLKWLEFTHVIIIYNIMFVIVVALCFVNNYKRSVHSVLIPEIKNYFDSTIPGPSAAAQSLPCDSR